MEAVVSAPELKKQLGLRHLIVFGLAYMTPIIVLGTYGVLAQTTQNAVPLAYVLALIVMLMTAYSYSQMAAVCGDSGSAYSYVKLALGETAGFFAGWTILLDYLFLPMVITLIGAVYLQSLIPDVPQAVWIVAILALTTSVNWIGLKLADRTNLVLLFIQLLVLAAFALLCLHYLNGNNQPFWSVQAFVTNENAFSLLTAGAAIACYSFLGFDAITTLAEETIDAPRTMPKAILGTTLIGGLIFIIVSAAIQFSHPNTEFANADAAASEIAKNIGGDLFVTLFVLGLVIGQLASAVSAQASGSRLIYAMAKKQALPKILAHLNVHRVPGLAVLLTAIIGLAALFLDITTSTSFINFGAFIGFILVNLSVLKYFWGQGRFIRRSLIPALGAIATLTLFVQLDKMAFMLGLAWLGLGLVRYMVTVHRNTQTN